MSTGHYYWLAARCDAAPGEHTRIGIATYGSDGRLTAWRLANLSRAVRRGDLPAISAGEDSRDLLLRTHAPAAMEEDMRKLLHSIGNAMSIVGWDGRLAYVEGEINLDTLWGHTIKEDSVEVEA